MKSIMSCTKANRDQELQQANHRIQVLEYAIGQLTRSIQILSSYKIRTASQLEAPRRSRQWMSMLTIFWFFACLLGCLFQSYQIADVYIAYDVTAEALFYPIDPIVPPMPTICIQHNYRNTTCNDSLAFCF